jgi:hypothetical protein
MTNTVSNIEQVTVQQRLENGVVLTFEMARWAAESRADVTIVGADRRPTFTGGRWTYDTTPTPDRTDAVQEAMFAADTVDQPPLFGAV